ncbi:MAG TPA: hemolysin family protein [Anaerolineales bacterium]
MASSLLGLLILLFVLILSAVLASTRSALVHSRLTELERLEQEGVTGAGLAARLGAESSRYLMSLRLAFAVVRSLIVGLSAVLLVAEAAAGLRLAVLALSLAGIGLAMSVIELLAENLVRREPERWAARLAPVAALAVAGMAPLGRLIFRLVEALVGAPRRAGHPVVTEEEIMTMVDAGEEGGSIEQDEKAMIYSIFQLDDTLAREVMVPRIDMLAFEEQTTLSEATDRLLETGYSRAPVFRGTIDDVIGLVFVKDLLGAWQEGEHGRTVGQLKREAYFVPEAKKVDELLEELQSRRVHMAVVVDEYGGTAGLVTLEDIVEEIIGEIRDEYDVAEEASFHQLEGGEYVFSGGIDLDDVNEIAGAELPKQAGETLGGFIYSELGRVPSPGDKLESGGLELVVDQVVRRRIRRVRARKLTAEPAVEARDNGQGKVDGAERRGNR